MRFGISTRVNLLAISGVVLLGSILGFHFVRHETRVLNEALDERASLLLNNLSAASEYRVLIRDTQAIAELVKGTLSQEDVVFCRIEDSEERPLYEEGAKGGHPLREYTMPLLMKKSTGEEEELIFGASTQTEKRIGTIYLAMSLARLNEKKTEIQLTMLAVGLVTSVLVSMAIAVLLRLVFSNPINSLIQGTRNIAEGKWRYKVPVKHNDEIGFLAASFNRMTDDLEKTTVSRDYMNNILSSMSDALLVLSPHGIIQMANASICSLLGFEAEELIGRPVRAILPDAELPFEKLIIRNRSIRESETVYQTKAGALIPMLFSASVLENEGQAVSGIVCAAKDITERKRAEQERERLIEELQQALTEVKTLSGLIPICSACKKIRDDRGYWNQIEAYIREHSDADFSHSICPECMERLYPGLVLKKDR